MTTSHYTIKGMHCASCANIIERKLKKISAIESVQVSYATESATVDHNGVSLEDINEIVKPLGYTFTAQEESSGSEVKEKQPQVNEEFTHLKNNVLISIPMVILSAIIMGWDIFGNQFGYLPAMSEIVKEFFHHLLPVFATYMMFVVGTPYLLGVWRFVRYGQANMDTLVGIGTLVAFIYSFIISAFEESLAPYLDVEIMYYDVTIIVIGFITLGKFLEVRAKIKTSDALKALVSLQAKSAIVMRNGVEQEIPLEEVVKGDLIVVKPGSKVPVDGIVVEGKSFIDESMITGEPMPVGKSIDDAVTGGTINQDGMLVVKAVGVGQESLLAHIIDLVKAAQSSRAPIQKLADKVSSIFVPVVIVIAILTLLGWLFIGTYYMPFNKALVLAITSFVGVLVIACPCALGLATPTAIIVGVGKGAQNGVLIKNAEALEKLSKIKDIVFDKTGTITEGKPKVISFFNTGSLKDDQVIELAAALENSSEHPLARAIISYAKLKEIAVKVVVEKFEAHKGKGITAHVDGQELFVGSDTFIKEITKLKLDEAIMKKELAKAHTPVILASKNKILAYFFVGDNIKAEAKEAIVQMKAYNIKTHMATGDTEAAAEAVSKAVGIDAFHARLLPEDKQILVRSLKENNSMVAVAGDGVNDAPAMALADVGIAMATGTDVAIETADITLLHGDIGKVAQAIKLSKQTLRTIKQNLFWAFAFNVIGIPLAAGAFYSFGITLNPAFAGAAMAFSSVLVVSNSLRLKITKL